MSYKHYFFYVVIIQVCTIIFLSIYIVKRRSQVLGNKIINPISRNDIITNKIGNLKHFYEPKPGVRSDDSQIPIATSYSINSDSLNERFDYTVEKPDSTYRIITLGDSFTFGHYVSTENNWTEVLESLLNESICTEYDKYEIINLGVYGYDLQYAIERYKLRGAKYTPDLILWLLKDDDFYRINELFLGKANEYTKQMKQNHQYESEIKKGNYAPGWEKAIKEMSEAYTKEELTQLSLSYLNKFRTSISEQISIITLPTESKEIREGMRRFGEMHSATSFYVVSRDIYDDDLFYYPNDYHPTKEGHKVIADDVFKYFMDNKIIPCN